MKQALENDTSHGWSVENKIGAVLFAGILLLFLYLTPSFAVPGRWAEMLASFSGNDPFRLPMRPIWSMLMVALDALPLSNLALAVNILSACLGASVCWMIYEMVRRIPFVRGRVWRNRTQVEQYPRIVAGLTSALYAGLSLPFLAASTRGDFSIFDIFMLCAALYPSLRYMHKPGNGLIYISFIIFGLGVAEYPGMMAMTPGFIIWWLVLTWRNITKLVGSLVFAVILMGVTGLLVSVVFSLVYWKSPVGEYREIASFWPVLVEYARFHIVELTRSVPKVGWLLILFSSVLPFIFIIFRQLEEPTELFGAIGVYAFRLILFAVGVVSLLNLMDSEALGISGIMLLLAPSVVSATWFGYLAGYHYGLLTRLSVRWPRRALVAILAILFVIAGIRHAKEINVDNLAVVASFTRETIGALHGRDWLVTDGTLDAQIALAARDAGVRVRLLKVGSWNSPMHVRYYTSAFEDPEMINLASIGLRPLLAEFNRAGELDRRVGVLVPPEYINASGNPVRPSGYYYTLADANSVVDPLALLQEYQVIWQSTPFPVLSEMEPSTPGYKQAMFIIRWFSRMANDVGVMLDDRDQRGLAAKAYEQALQYWPDNISVTINQIAAAKTHEPELVDILEEKLGRQITRLQGQMDLRTAIYVCGVIRDPVLKLSYAALLGRAGQRAQLNQELDRVSELLDAKDVESRLKLAQLYQQGRQVEESEKILKSLHEEHPGRSDVLYGLYNLAVYRKDFDKASRLLGQLEEAGADPDRLLLEKANLDLSAGRIDEARQQLEVITRNPSAPIEAWYALATIAMRQKDGPLMRKIRPLLEDRRDFLPGMFILGDLAVQQKNLEQARTYFERVVAMDSSNISALERLIQIDYDLRDAGSLRRHAAQLLVVDPDHALGHYAAANVHIDQQRYDLAEIALRKCLELRAFAPAQNDLAWILSRRGEQNEALVLAQRALETQPEDANYLDTIAGIYGKRNEQQQAIDAITKALELTARRNPVILIHAVRIYQEAGHDSQLDDLFVALDELYSTLPVELQREIDTLKVK